MARTEESFSHVTDAEIKELRDVDITDVYDYMDTLLEKRADPYQLYLRWERQQWKTQDIDFTEDRQHWDLIDEGMRTEIYRPFCLFFMGEQLVTDTLGPFVVAAPSEEERLFLTTQIVDEARHAVFFTRFFNEVLGGPAGLHEALEYAHLDDAPGFDRIFRKDLVEIADRLRMAPDDYGNYVDGVTLYHLIVEGFLALTGQKYLLEVFRNVGLMPGFYSGFTAVARDESRHVNFGVWTLRKAITQEGMGERVAEAARRWAVPAAEIISAPHRQITVSPAEVPPPFRVDPRKVREFSIISLTKRLRAAGLPAEDCESVREVITQQYEEGQQRYESQFGEHPIRWYERQESV